MQIRKATLADIHALYAFALAFPELQVSSTEPFMHPDEFRYALSDPESLALVAEEEKIIGFVYARLRDLDKPAFQTACIVYLVVDKDHRKKGIATQLFNACVAELKAKGVTYVFSWIHAHSPEIRRFMKKQGFAEGHTYTWMDRKI